MSETSVLIVGGGILGTMHALSAVDRGYKVTQIEREVQARGASLRNFGLVWVSGRAKGRELEMALRARERWEAVGKRCPAIGFRPNGSFTLARTAHEQAVLEEAANGPDARMRGFTLCEPDEVRRRNPALQGTFVAGLFCERDAGVEPRLATQAIQAYLAESGNYIFLPGREIQEVSATRAIDHLGNQYRAELIVVTTGAAHVGLGAEVLGSSRLRRVRLQMFETEPFEQQLTTSLADGDSLRYYPGFDLPTRAGLQAQHPQAQRDHMQLLCQQRLNGSLTIGDTHAYDEPFDFDLDERTSDYLVDVLSSLLGTKIPPIARRWAGVYSQIEFDPEGPVYFRESVDDGVVFVSGPGGRGMTLAPEIAEETFA